MNVRLVDRFVAALGMVIMSAGAAGCVAEPSSSAESQAATTNGAYEIQMVSMTSSGLPKCTSALAGTLAYVSSPSGLWTCDGTSWSALACTASDAGKVAYSSSPPVLLACGEKEWTPITLPQGPQGATGATGATGAQGAAGAQGDAGLESLILVTPLPVGSSECPAGGDQIQTGIDRNGDGVLEPNEVQQTAYVCNGAAGASGNGQLPSSPSDPEACTPAIAGTLYFNTTDDEVFACNGTAWTAI